MKTLERKRELEKNFKQVVNSYKITYLMIHAERLGVFQVLKNIPMPIESCAYELKVTKERLEPILNALVSYGWIEKNYDGYYLGEKRDLFDCHADWSYAKYLRFISHMMQNWENLDKAIQDPKVAKENYEYLTKEQLGEFLEGLYSIEGAEAKYIKDHYYFENHKILVVGAGGSRHAVEIANKFKKTQISIIDSKVVIEELKRKIEKEECKDQINLIVDKESTSLFDEKYDDVLLFDIIHTLNDETLVKLLNKIYEMLNKNGRLFLTSLFLNEDRLGPEYALQFAIENVLFLKDGKVYTKEEIQTYIKQAKFNNIYKIEENPGDATLYISEKL